MGLAWSRFRKNRIGTYLYSACGFIRTSAKQNLFLSKFCRLVVGWCAYSIPIRSCVRIEKNLDKHLVYKMCFWGQKSGSFEPARSFTNRFKLPWGKSFWNSRRMRLFRRRQYRWDKRRGRAFGYFTEHTGEFYFRPPLVAFTTFEFTVHCMLVNQRYCLRVMLLLYFALICSCSYSLRAFLPLDAWINCGVVQSLLKWILVFSEVAVNIL